jgi:hypothetical protein
MALPNFVKIVNSVPVVEVGAMRHVVTILQLGASSPVTYDASGVAASTWNTFMAGYVCAIGGQAAGAVRGGTDVSRVDQTASQLTLVVVGWYVPGVVPNMRITSENGSTYIIQSIENVLEMNAVMVMTCLGIGAND